MDAQVRQPNRAADYDALILPDRINGRMYYEPAIFEEELQKIWYGDWVFVGHASEVRDPGEYRTGHIGRQQIVMARDMAGELHLFLNRCRHRGNTICQGRRGKTQGFICAYHGWTYDLDGTLKAVPFADGYGESLDKGNLGLTKVPRVGVYRGFVFASLNPGAQPFDEYLGAAKDSIDRFCDLSPSGEIEMRSGVWRMKIHANWKMWLENSVDLYHAPSTHASNAYMASFEGKKGPEFAKQVAGMGAGFNQVELRDLGSGHVDCDMRPLRRKIGMTYTGEWTEGVSESASQAFQDAMIAFHGKEKAERIAIDGPPHTVMFPNLFFMLQDIRWCVPVAPDLTYLYYAPVTLKGAPDEINTIRLRRDEGAYGPAGFQLSDDIEVWERNFRGIQTRTNEWNLLNRGIDLDISTDAQGLHYQTEQSEYSMRIQWARYKEIMGAS